MSAHDYSLTVAIVHIGELLYGLVTKVHQTTAQAKSQVCQRGRTHGGIRARKVLPVLAAIPNFEPRAVLPTRNVGVPGCAWLRCPLAPCRRHAETTQYRVAQDGQHTAAWITWKARE